MKGIIGKKIGMTSVFGEGGRHIPCTIIEAGPCVVTQKKTVEVDGYDALQIAFKDSKEKNTSNALKGHFAKANTTPKAIIKEIRNSSLEKELGDSFSCDIFEEGELVNVIGISKGKGFQGVVRRHGFSGVGESTHGQKNRLRAPGSIGASSDPSRVFKGKRMAGQMGGTRSKVRGLKVLKVFPEQNYLLVTGSIPGHKGSIVLIENN